MLNTPFAPWPSFSEEEVDAVAAVLRSNKVNYWTGDEGRQFEREFAAWAGTPYAIALANGTLALDLALHGLGIGRANGGSDQDEVIVTPRTFIASISSVVNAGAKPVFADVDADSGNLSAATIDAVRTANTRAVILVHLGGWPADMDPIMAMADRHDFKVIEDCAQAHGARYKGRPVGSIGHVAAWSFCQDKIMTTGGEGGMVTCHDRDLWSRMWSYKDHGKSWTKVYETAHPPGFRWLHDSFGTNWRMMEMQATIGRIQLTRMAEWTTRRNAHAGKLITALKPFAGHNGLVRIPPYDRLTADGSVHAQYKFYVYLHRDRLPAGVTRQALVDAVNAQGVPCFSGSCSEVYLEKAFDGTGYRPDRPLPVAAELGESSLMMLVHPTISDTDMDKAAAALGTALSAVSS